jgi:hypothetical protein
MKTIKNKIPKELLVPKPPDIGRMVYVMRKTESDPSFCRRQYNVLRLSLEIFRGKPPFLAERADITRKSPSAILYNIPGALINNKGFYGCLNFSQTQILDKGNAFAV